MRTPADTTSPLAIGDRVRLMGTRTSGTVARHEHYQYDVVGIVVRFDDGYVGEFRRTDLEPDDAPSQWRTK